MNKKIYEDDLFVEMQKELQKQASTGQPNLIKAAECLHSAMEIFEETGLQARANDILNILFKIAQQEVKKNSVQKMPPIASLMEAGFTQRDLHEFSKGNPIARAKLNLILRDLGISNAHVAKFLGHNFLTEEEAKTLLDPNRSFGKINEWISNPNSPTDPNNVQPGETLEISGLSEKSNPLQDSDEVLKFKSIAKKNKNLSSEKMVKNLKEHGTVFNMADDNFAADQAYASWLKKIQKPEKFSKEDIDPELSGLLDVDSFDIDASDDDLLNLEITEDSLEVFDKEIPLEDFEDEKDVGQKVN